MMLDDFILLISEIWEPRENEIAFWWCYHDGTGGRLVLSMKEPGPKNDYSPPPPEAPSFWQSDSKQSTPHALSLRLPRQFKQNARCDETNAKARSQGACQGAGVGIFVVVFSGIRVILRLPYSFWAHEPAF